jgi:hypothetical protein
MILYGIYLYIIVGHIREILICYTYNSIVKRVQERIISWRIEMIYIINFHHSSYEFEIDLYVNLGKLWNDKFQTK